MVCKTAQVRRARPANLFDGTTLTSKTTTLKHLASRLTEQTLEVAALRAALEVQARRIARMQAELDLWPHAPGFRHAIRALSAERPSGNGHHHTPRLRHHS